jgi:phenylalanyl-tRNA synthetase alpha chain
MAMRLYKTPMTIDEKVVRTLAELGVTEQRGVTQLFEELQSALDAECQGILGLESDLEFSTRATALRDRWRARRNGLERHVRENWLNRATVELRPFVGWEFNNFKGRADRWFDQDLPKRRERIKGYGASFHQRVKAKQGGSREPEAPSDLTLPGLRRPLGSIHPVTRMQREIEDIFLRLGFWIESGPEIESTYYNFDALNIPESHPSRDDWDTLYIDSKTVLRTHTSPVQIRAMEKYGAPLYIIAPGKCYRHDNPDPTHSPMFHHIEGLAIDEDITFADLKGTLDFFAKKLFGEKVRTRFQPSFFPFTEPSGEVVVSCFVCDGQGCRVCKESGWIELMGCGMVHPQVLRNGGIDPDKYSGWAFGLGVDRFAMVKYDINDIQLFFQGDVRFLEQF